MKKTEQKKQISDNALDSVALIWLEWWRLC